MFKLRVSSQGTEREREIERERETHRERHTERQTGRQTDRHTDIQIQRDSCWEEKEKYAVVRCKLKERGLGEWGRLIETCGQDSFRWTSTVTFIVARVKMN